MKALVYEGPGKVTLADKPKPELHAPGDAVVRVTLTTICGTDLHIIKGDVPTCEPGRTLGHQGVGVVESVGAAVTSLTLRFRLDDILAAYDTLRNAAKTQALKVIIAA